MDDSNADSRRFEIRNDERLDFELRARGIVTLSELRRRYSKACARIMKQGRIRNDTEFYLIRNVLDDPTEKTAEERNLLAKMVFDYESI